MLVLCANDTYEEMLTLSMAIEDEIDYFIPEPGLTSGDPARFLRLATKKIEECLKVVVIASSELFVSDVFAKIAQVAIRAGKYIPATIGRRTVLPDWFSQGDEILDLTPVLKPRREDLELLLALLSRPISNFEHPVQ